MECLRPPEAAEMEWDLQRGAAGPAVRRREASASPLRGRWATAEKFSFGFAAAATSVSAGGSGIGRGRKSAAAGDREAGAEQRDVAGDIAIQTLQLQEIMVTAPNLASRLDRAASAGFLCGRFAASAVVA
jgi:hypothetical protein